MSVSVTNAFPTITPEPVAPQVHYDHFCKGIIKLKPTELMA